MTFPSNKRIITLCLKEYSFRYNFLAEVTFKDMLNGIQVWVFFEKHTKN